MTRKRAVKLLMARGYSRNLANGLMQNKPVNNSNLQAYKKYLLFDRIVDATEKATKLCCAYGAAWDAIELTCRFCGADSRCKVEEVYLRPRTPPMFCVRCYNCGRAGKPKGTKKTAIRAWKKAK